MSITETFRCDKTPEELKLQGFGSFETLDSKLRHGTSLKFADVRPHLRKVLKMTLYILRTTVLKASLFILEPSDKLLDGLGQFIGFLGIE